MEKIQWIPWQEPQDRAGLHSRLVNIHLRNSSREVGSDNRARDASVSRAPVKFSISFTLIMLIYSKLQILRVATTTYHYHNNFKFYLQLNVYASLSREWIDLAWLNVMVCVWRSTKTSKIEKILGFDPTCFQTSSGADECIDIGCWEVPRCHTIPREISAYSDDGHLVRPSLFTLKMSRCRGRVTFKVTQIHSYAFWDYHWPKY